ncbi:hypothetical protein P9112_000181 [Eukaryota sp. TZLM1-RC]
MPPQPYPGDIYLQCCQKYGISPKTELLKILRSDRLSKVHLTNDLDTLDVSAVLEALSQTNTSTLRITGIALDPSTVQTLVKLLSSSKTITKLALRSTQLSSQSLSIIFKSASSLNDLVIADNFIPDDCLSSLSSSLPFLTTLSLISCQLTDNSCHVISPFLRTSKLQSLYLEDNSITYQGTELLASSLPSSLISFSIAGNPIANRGVTLLSPLLCLFSILDLRSCNIGPHGIASLCQCLSDNAGNVTALALDDNRIGSKGALSLARILTSLKNLEELSLNNNKIGDGGAVALAYAAAMHDSLVKLFLEDNLVGDKGAEALVNVFNNNSKVLFVSIIGNYLTEEGEVLIGNQLEEVNQSQGEFNIDGQNDYVMTCDDVYMTRELEEWFFSNRDDIYCNVSAVIQRYRTDQEEINDEIFGILHSLAGPSMDNVSLEDSDRIPTTIDLSNQNITPADVSAFAEALRLCNTISKITISNTNFHCEHARILSTSLINSATLRTFSLRHHSLAADGSFVLGQALGSSGVVRVVITDSSTLNDHGLSYLLKGLMTHTNSITSLDLSRLAITSRALSYLGKYLSTTNTIQDLCLDGSNLSNNSNSDFKTFVESIIMANNSLNSLSLRSCGLDDVIQSDLIGLVTKSSSLKKLILEDNKFSVTCQEEITSRANFVEVSFNGGLNRTSRTPVLKTSKFVHQPINDDVLDDVSDCKKLEDELSKVVNQIECLNIKKNHLLSAIRRKKEEKIQEISEKHLEIALGEASKSTENKAPSMTEISKEFKLDYDRSYRTYTANIAFVDSKVRSISEEVNKTRKSLEDSDTVVNDFLAKRDGLINQMKEILLENDGLTKAESIQNELEKLESMVLESIKKRDTLRDQLLTLVDQLSDSISEYKSHLHSFESHLDQILTDEGGNNSPNSTLDKAYEVLTLNLTKLAELKSFCGLVEQRDKEAFDKWTRSKEKLDLVRNSLNDAENEEINSYEAFLQARRCTQEAYQEEQCLVHSMGLDDLGIKVDNVDDITSDLVPIAQSNYEFYSKIAAEKNNLGKNLKKLLDHTRDSFSIADMIKTAQQNFETAREKLALAQEARADADTLRQQINDWGIQISKLETSLHLTREDQNRARIRGDFSKFRETQKTIEEYSSHLNALQEARNSAVDDLSRLEKVGVEAEESVVQEFGETASEYFLVFDKLN